MPIFRRCAVSREGIAIVRRFVEFLNEGNEAALEALVANDYVCHVAGGLAAGAEGPEVWRRRAGALRTAFPDYHITIEELLADADKVVMRYRGQGTHCGPLFGARPTNAVVTYTGIAIFRISGGKLAEEWTEYDQLGTDAADRGAAGHRDSRDLKDPQTWF